MLAHLKKWFGLYLVLIVILYLIIGATIPFMRYKQLSRETIQDADAVVTAVTNAEGVSVDRAMLLESNVQALEERIRLLNMAKERIILSTFDMRQGESTDDIAAMLLEKADEGVQVSLLIDGFNGSFRLPGRDFFQALSSHPNIEIRLYNPINLLTPWTSQGRMHDKYVIVDDLAYILGGRNTFDYFLGDAESEHRSLDREILIYNTAWGTESQESSLWQVKSYFEKVWNGGYCKVFGEREGLSEKPSIQRERQRLEAEYEKLVAEKPELFDEYDYETHTCETENVTLLSGDTGIYGKEPVILYQLGELMKQAEENVLIHTPYAVCNSYMYQVLREIKEEVPDTVMMLNSIENGDNFCASSDYMRNKQEIVDTGITLYEYDGGDSYHGKSIVIDDDISIIGSFNFDLRSTYMDTELMLVVKSEELNAELRSNMEKMEQQCRHVLSASAYEVPEGLTIAEVPFGKKVAMKIFGFVVQGFRYLL
ncbi:MAG: phospholipase D family protein [Lachnospiraceae bacterium]